MWLDCLLRLGFFQLMCNASLIFNVKCVEAELIIEKRDLLQLALKFLLSFKCV